MTVHKVILAEYTNNDLLDIYCYIALEDSFESADKLIQQLKDACYSLSKLPNRGHVPHEFAQLAVSNYLEIHCNKYRIIYETVGKMVYVYCIIHMKRDVHDLLTERLLS